MEYLIPLNLCKAQSFMASVCIIVTSGRLTCKTQTKRHECHSGVHELSSIMLSEAV